MSFPLLFDAGNNFSDLNVIFYKSNNLHNSFTNIYKMSKIFNRQNYEQNLDITHKYKSQFKFIVAQMFALVSDNPKKVYFILYYQTFNQSLIKEAYKLLFEQEEF